MLDRAVTPLAAIARITGKYSGLRAGHDRVHRHLLDVELPELAVGGRAQPADDLVALAAACRASIASTRSSVGRTIGRKSVQLLSMKSCWRLSSVSGSSSRGIDRSKERPVASSASSGCVSPSISSCTNGRPLTGSVALDVVAELGGRAADDGLRDESLAGRRHPVDAGDRAGESGENVGVHRDRRHPALLERHREPDDRRAARASEADAEDRRVTVLDDRRRACPGRRPSSPSAGSRVVDTAGRCSREPVLQLAP